MIPFLNQSAEIATAIENADVDDAPRKIQAGHETLRQGIEQLREFSLDDFVNSLAQKLVNLALNIAIAILVFYVGKFIIKRIYRVVANLLVKRNADHSLSTFVLSFVKIVLYFILIVTVIGILGIETSSFLALFASAGVAIGMALSGTLQNFAGGVLLLLLKPYKIGDYIEAQGYAGYVREIQIFHTIITTYDNKAILLPNGGLSTSSINNWSREDYRRISWEVAISYGDNVADAREAILEMFAQDPRIVTEQTVSPEDELDPSEKEDIENIAQAEVKRPSLWRRLFGNRGKVKEALEKWEENRNAKLQALKPKVVKAPMVTVDSLGDSSVNLVARAWVHTADYWVVFYDYTERFYNELPKHGINFPFPQMDVHLDSKN